MAEITNASLVFKDKDGNIGKVNTLSASDIAKLQTTRNHVAKIVDQSTGELIQASTSVLGVVQFATDADVNSGTESKVVDAKQLNSVKSTLSTFATKSGTNAFTGINTVPNLTSSSGDSQIANKKYVDDNVATLTAQLPDIVKYSATPPPVIQINC